MSYLSYVNVKQGSASSMRFSNGNTLPLTQLPWGMAGFIPQTEVRDKNWYFHPGDRSLEGVRLTHQPSPWIGDFGALIFMPQAGKPFTDADARWSGYRPENAVLAPDYMRLCFLRSEATLELTPTERGAAMRLTYCSDKPYFSLISAGKSFSCSLDAPSRRIYGSTDFCSRKVPDGYRMYFVAEFDCDFDVSETAVEPERAVHAAMKEKMFNVRFAISFISEQQAVRNLENELSGRDFDMLRSAASERWESILGRVRIETDDMDLMRTFYSCLYRTFLYPNKMYEIDSDGEPVHYDSYNDKVRSGIMYTNNGFWDTYRTVYPLYSIIAPDEFAEILDGYLQLYDNTGWLPKWPSLTETGCMPGSLVDAVLAQGAVSGILTGNKLRKALEGMLKHASQAGEGPFGRTHLACYLEYGYVARDIATESVNCSLDYAYGDFCIARVAQCLGETEIMEEYDKRSKNYRRLFDASTGFMRGRDLSGNMSDSFDPFAWGGEYTEGSAWQSSFAVCHDIEGLAKLHGGREALLKKLDELFATPPYYRIGGYGREIHEMTEMAAQDFGQCAISNQPSFHFPWLFAVLGRQDKTAYWVKRLVMEAFSWKSDGFPGDEDNGTTAAWYVFAVLGIYPVCPGKPEFVKGIPLVGKMWLCGKELHIEGDGFICIDEIRMN